MSETVTITRKLQLIPESALNNSKWSKRCYDHCINAWNDKINYYNKKIKTEKDKENLKLKIGQLQDDLINLKDNGTFTKQMVNDYTYNLVKGAMASESQRKNCILGYMLSEFNCNNREIRSMSIKDRNNLINELLRKAYRVANSKVGDSLFDDIDIPNQLGRYGIAFSQNLTKKIKDAVGQGLLEGRVSLPHYKMNSPFTIEKSAMGFEHGYNDIDELYQNIHKNKPKIYFNFGGNGSPTIARFMINVGTKGNREELLLTLLKVYDGTYQYCGSSIQLDKTGTKIILNLNMKIPVQELTLDKDTVVGVDLGIAIPAVCALNNNKFVRSYIGKDDNLIRERTKLQNQRKRLQTALTMTKGGHGRKKKLQALERLKEKEKNFVNTYCHKVSSRVVNFAIKNRAKYINLEDLTGYDTNDKILRNWSYYKLQQQIIYKASRYGIEVRKVIPSYTSQVCSYCGHYEEGQRKTQSQFVCGNPDCITHDFKCGVNADYNAAVNIAKSKLFYDKKITGIQINKAREYYQIA